MIKLNSPPDYKALCAELADALETWCETWHPLAYTDPRISLRLIADRARAALAVEAVGPSDEELLELAEPFSSDVGDGFTKMVDDEIGYARAVLARWGNV